MDGGVGYFCKDEWIHVDPEYYFAISHAIVAFFMVITYYNFKVPLGGFKREKEVGRRVEFDGLYLSEQVTLTLTLSVLPIFIVFQPEDDDIKAHWDKLVVSAKSFPCLYWDKFIKKRVSHKVFVLVGGCLHILASGAPKVCRPV